MLFYFGNLIITDIFNLINLVIASLYSNDKYSTGIVFNNVKDIICDLLWMRPAKKFTICKYVCMHPTRLLWIIVIDKSELRLNLEFTHNNFFSEPTYNLQ